MNSENVPGYYHMNSYSMQLGNAGYWPPQLNYPPPPLPQQPSEPCYAELQPVEPRSLAPKRQNLLDLNAIPESECYRPQPPLPPPVEHTMTGAAAETSFDMLKELMNTEADGYAKKLSVEKERWERHFEAQKKEIKDHQAALDAERQANKRLKRATLELQAEVQNFKKHTKTLNSEKEAIANRMEQARDSHRKDVQRLEEQLEKRATNEAEFHRSIKQVMAERDDSVSEYLELLDVQHTLKDELQEWREHKGICKDRVAVLEKERAEAMTEAAELRAEAAGSLQRENAAAQNLVEARQQLSALRTADAALNDDLQQLMDTLETERRTHYKERAALRAEVTRLRVERDEAQAAQFAGKRENERLGVWTRRYAALDDRLSRRVARRLRELTAAVDLRLPYRLDTDSGTGFAGFGPNWQFYIEPTDFLRNLTAKMSKAKRQHLGRTPKLAIGNEPRFAGRNPSDPRDWPEVAEPMEETSPYDEVEVALCDDEQRYVQMLNKVECEQQVPVTEDDAALSQNVLLMLRHTSFCGDFSQALWRSIPSVDQPAVVAVSDARPNLACMVDAIFQSHLFQSTPEVPANVVKRRKTTDSGFSESSPIAESFHLENMEVVTETGKEVSQTAADTE